MIDAVPHFPVIIVGGGQAGLSASWFLTRAGIRHLVLEQHAPFHAWREERWDSFCLVTPNWQCRLPGYPYAGPDPEGFMPKDEILRYLDGFVASFDPPLRNHVTVTRLAAAAGGGFSLATSAGMFHADQVVVATGAYQVPIIPGFAASLPEDVVQLHSSNYRRPEQLPAGATLVVGTGQSGCQVAEDLHLVGRQVHLSVGDAPRVARRYRGRDVVAWLDAMGYYDMPVERHPLREGVRDKTNHYVTGRDGGRDIDLRRRATEGMKLYGQLAAVEGDGLRFNDDLARNLDAADATSENIKLGIDGFIAREGIEAPTEAAYVPPWTPPAEPVRALNWRQAGITGVVWCIGFRSDHAWVDLPVFEHGAPRHRRGVTDVPGLYFLGLPWLHSWGSGRFSGIARDAEHVMEHIAARQTVSS